MKRPNVDVRARRGYRAATREEIEEGKLTAAAAETAAPPALVQGALNALGSARPGVRSERLSVTHRLVRTMATSAASICGR